MADRSLQFNVFGRATTRGFGKAAAEVEFLAGRLKGLRDQRVSVKADVDKGFFSKINAGMGFMQSGAKWAGEQGSALLGKFGSALGSATQTGIVGASILTLAIMHLGPVIVQATGLVLGLGAGLAAIAGISMAGLAIGFIAAIGPAMKLFKAVQEGDEGIRKLPKSLQAGAKAAKSFIDTFKSWGTHFEAPVGRIVAIFSNLGKAILPKLTPIADGILGVVESIGAKAEKSLGGPIWSNFFRMMETDGVKVFDQVSNSAGHFFNGLISLLTQSSPFATSLATKINNMAISFERWTQSARGQKDVKEFFAWVRKEAPVFGKFLGDVGPKLWAFIKDLGSKDIAGTLDTFAKGITLAAGALEALMTVFNGVHKAWSGISGLIKELPIYPGEKAKKAPAQWKGVIDGVLEVFSEGFDSKLYDMAAGMDERGYALAYQVAQGIQYGADTVSDAAATLAQAVEEPLDRVSEGKFERGYWASIQLSYGLLNGTPLIWDAAHQCFTTVDEGMGDLAAGKWERGYAVGARTADGIWGSIQPVMSAARQIKTAIDDQVNDLAAGMYGRGANVGRQLAAGINDQVDLVAAASARLAAAASANWPASPVKKGPLRILNNGYTGKKMAQMISGGMLQGRKYVAEASTKMAGSAAGPLTPQNGTQPVNRGPAVNIEHVTVQSPMDVAVFTRRLAFETRAVSL